MALKPAGGRRLVREQNRYHAATAGCMNWIMRGNDHLASALMSALGHKRTLTHVRVLSALPPKADITGHCADITRRLAHVRFTPKANISRTSLHVRYVPEADMRTVVDRQPPCIGANGARHFRAQW
jgi:hypothetical protein